MITKYRPRAGGVIEVPYYNPSIWITDPSDRLIDICENKIKLIKTARPKEQYGKCFLPIFHMEWIVVIKETDEMLSLKQYADRTGKIDIDLLDDIEALRKGHYNHKKPHTNPDGQIIPFHHVHFPTIKYPHLYSEARKYAYSSQVTGKW